MMASVCSAFFEHTISLLYHISIAVSLLKPFEITRDCVTLQSELGKGRFGTVLQGSLHSAARDDVPVAVKFLNNANDAIHLRSFRIEASRLSEAQHPNVIALLAVCFASDPPFIVVELAINGDMKAYLRHCRESHPGRLRTAQLSKFSLDASYGFAYLAEQKLVHRDLACRNMLLMADFTVKIGDFGLHQEIVSSSS